MVIIKTNQTPRLLEMDLSKDSRKSPFGINGLIKVLIAIKGIWYTCYIVRIVLYGSIFFLFDFLFTLLPTKSLLKRGLL